MFLFQKIEEVMMTYHDARSTIAQFILQEKDALYTYTIEEIAQHTYTSKATVVRFAKTLGYDGWREFIKDYVAEKKYQDNHVSDVDVNYPFQADSSIDEMIENIQKVQVESIQDTKDLLDKQQLKKATSYLLDAKHIVIFALSPNIFLAELFRRKMITINKQVDIARIGEMGIISRTMNEKDCAIVISYSGNNVEVEPMSHINTLLQRHVPIIGITSGGDNYMRNVLDCVLTMSSKEKLYTKIANFATEESLQFILNVLFSNVYASDYEMNNVFKVDTARKLETRRSTKVKYIKDE